MAESYVQVNVPATAGKKLKTWESVDGSGNVVESEAVTLTNAAGDEVLIATEATVAAIAASAASIDAKIRPPAGTGTLTVIPATNVAVDFLLADPGRLGFSIFNQSQTDTLYVLLAGGGPVSPTLFTVLLQPNAYFEDAFGYTGHVSGVWGSVGINAQALVNAYTV